MTWNALYHKNKRLSASGEALEIIPDFLEKERRLCSFLLSFLCFLLFCCHVFIYLRFTSSRERCRRTVDKNYSSNKKYFLLPTCINYIPIGGEKNIF